MNQSLTIRTLERKDYSKAIDFAVKGMHFDCYMESPALLKTYGCYFLYMELNRATQVLAAYDGSELAGVLLAKFYGESPVARTLWQRIYVAGFRKLERLYTNGTSIYDQANQSMFRAYCEQFKPEGELIFLAADPDSNRKGVGSALLAELEQRENGKELFLYTDSNCTFQFYEHRGFQQAGKKEVTMELPDGAVPLTCYLYHKKLGGDLR